MHLLGLVAQAVVRHSQDPGSLSDLGPFCSWLFLLVLSSLLWGFHRRLSLESFASRDVGDLHRLGLTQ